MTEQPGRQHEERLPAPRPSSAPPTASRFSAPPSAHRNDLTPERAARIVRQSANARWVGFLAVTVVALFVIGYYFYELGLPGGLTQPRLDAAASAQQVTDVERGYNIFQANCAQCHGVNGEGGKGPTLNDQSKLFAHLNPDYIRNMLQVGGRYACGNPNSIMPVWSNTGNPPGPLNYMQINDVIAFIRASKANTYVKLDPNLFEPIIDPTTKQVETFTGWVDPNYSPAPGATPFPACWTDAFKTSASASPAASSPASAAPGASGSAPAPSGSAPAGSAPAASQAPTGTTLNLTALNVAFDKTQLAAPADTPFTIHLDNQDQGIPHNVVIRDASGNEVFNGPLVTGPGTADYSIKALPAGQYTFLCIVHPQQMNGTLKVGG
ncbi:MAG: c-type cytochrome [Candidatus Limnocylindrales bacterium]